MRTIIFSTILVIVGCQSEPYVIRASIDAGLDGHAPECQVADDCDADPCEIAECKEGACSYHSAGPWVHCTAESGHETTCKPDGCFLACEKTEECPPGPCAQICNGGLCRTMCF